MGDLIDIQALIAEKAAKEKADEEIAIEYEKQQLREHLRYVIDRLAELEPGFKEELSYYRRIPTEHNAWDTKKPAERESWIRQILQKIRNSQSPEEEP